MSKLQQLYANKASYSIIAVCVCAVLTACGGGGGGSTAAPPPVTPPPPPPPPMGGATKGETVFTSAMTNGNQFSCANCHSISEDTAGLSTVDALHRPASPLFNAVNRASYHNGNTANLFDAVNICLEDWMDATPLTESSESWLDLNAYLDQQSDTQTPANIVTTQIAPITDFSQGVVDTGKDIFNQTCATCHGPDAVGTTLAASLSNRTLSKDRVAEKVRTTGPTTSQVFANLMGGNMPFWSEERLSDDDLSHIATYVNSFSVTTPAPMSCSGTDHPKVGQMAILSTNAHAVSGTATILDNCTIEVTNFNYDGGGPDVLFYVAEGTDYKDGYGLGQRINGMPQNNSTITLTLAAPSELNTINGISVWCAQFDASFGDGRFM